MNEEDLDIKTLWYIIPGLIFLFPFIVSGAWLFKSDNGFSFIFSSTILAYTVGFILHQVYRLIYHLFFLYEREAIIFFKKQFDVSSSHDAEYLYNMFLYGNKKIAEDFKWTTEKIRKQSSYFSAISTSALSIMLGFVILLLYSSTNFMCLVYVYLLIGIVLSIYAKLLFQVLNDTEIYLIKFVSINERKYGVKKNITKFKKIV